MDHALTSQDVIRLSKNFTVDNKISTAQKISAYYNGNSLTAEGMKIAEDIFRLMVHDVEIKVRAVLSESLKKARNIPQDIIESIINDHDSVAVPFIKYYQDFSREDLLQILEFQSINKQKAVAERENLTEDISQYIVEKCPEDVVNTLIQNPTANIKEQSYFSIINKYHDSNTIKESLISRPELPVTVIEKIVNYLSQELKRRLIITIQPPDRHCQRPHWTGQRKTTLRISEEYSSDKQIEELVHQLYSNNRLTPSLVVRSICLGDLTFFEYALVYLSNTPITEVRKILFNTSLDFMIRNLLRKAYIPKSMFPAVFSALKVIQEIRFDVKDNNRVAFSHRVIERILSFGNAADEFKEEDINYLISKNQLKFCRGKIWPLTSAQTHS